MYPRRLLITLAISTLLSLTACATDTTPGATVTSYDDALVNQQVIRAVRAVAGVDMADMTVSTRDGVVILKGRTTTRKQAQEAIEAARHVPGAKKVDYDISVDQQP